MAQRTLRALVCAAGYASAIKVGDKLPEMHFDYGFPPEKVPVNMLCGGRTMVIVGLPGAFTPT